MSKNDSSLKVNVDDLIQEFRVCNKDLNDLTDEVKSEISLIFGPNIKSSELRLLGISKKINNLLKMGYVEGVEKSVEYGIEGGIFNNKLQRERKTDLIGSHTQESIFFEHVQWHIIKVKEFIDELELIKKFNLSNSEILLDNQPEDQEPLELDVSHEDHTGKIKVFISHKFVKSDQKLAETLRISLDNHGIYGYNAERKKEYDIVFEEKIKHEISTSDYLVAIITKNSKSAPSVHQEIGCAKGADIPVRILVEENEAKGVLVEGKDMEKFLRQNFEQSLENVIIDIKKKGLRKKIKSVDKELIQNVYDPCYNKMMNVYKSRIFFVGHLNPWKDISYSWKLRTESDIKDLFEEYSKQLEIWMKIFRTTERNFEPNVNEIVNLLSIVFKRNPSIQKDGELTDHIQFDAHFTMLTIDWVRKFKYVLFDDDITNQNQLYKQLVEFAKLIPDQHEAWLVRLNNTTDVFGDMMDILPQIREKFYLKLRLKELKSEHQKLKEIIEQLIISLEEKLK